VQVLQAPVQGPQAPVRVLQARVQALQVQDLPRFHMRTRIALLPQWQLHAIF
jgi:hypothetical protein